MNAQIKNWITSIIGALLMTGGLVFFFLAKVDKIGLDISLLEMFGVEAMGLLLLWAWNALLQKFVKKTLGL